MQYENSFYASMTVTVIILPKIHTSMLTRCMLLLSFHFFVFHSFFSLAQLKQPGYYGMFGIK